MFILKSIIYELLNRKKLIEEEFEVDNDFYI